MRLLLTAAFLLTAVAGSSFADGRYQTAIAPASDEWPNIIQIVITDTKNGAVEYCFSKQKRWRLPVQLLAADGGRKVNR